MDRFTDLTVLSLCFCLLQGAASEASHNQAPRISFMSLTGSPDVIVSESTEEGSVVALISTFDDDDDDIVRCTTEPELNVVEVTDYMSFIGEVTLSQSLDREFASEYQVQIVCNDFGSPPLSSTATLTFTVQDENDNPPTFPVEMFSMTVNEAEPVGTFLLRVAATDRDSDNNGDIRYSLGATEEQEEDLASTFRIGAITGRIYTTTSLDREAVAHWHFLVVARDLGTPSLSTTATVNITVVDANDNAPNFLPICEQYISKQAAVGTNLVTFQALDEDEGQNAQVTFSLLDTTNAPGTPFSVSPAGLLSLVNPLDPDLPQFTKYILLVQATDGGTPSQSSSVEVTVTVV